MLDPARILDTDDLVLALLAALAARGDTTIRENRAHDAGVRAALTVAAGAASERVRALSGQCFEDPLFGGNPTVRSGIRSAVGFGFAQWPSPSFDRTELCFVPRTLRQVLGAWGEDEAVFHAMAEAYVAARDGDPTPA